MLNNKKGAALLQVLLVTAVLAGMATMLLRASLSRTTTARQTRRVVSAQLLVNSCMAEVNMIWSHKTAAAFANDMRQCIMYCDSSQAEGNCSNPKYSHTCTVDLNGSTYEVVATMSAAQDAGAPQDEEGQCKLTYDISDKNSNDVEL